MTGKSTYTDEVGRQICELIAQGKASREICTLVGIANSTLFKWLADNPSFSEQYARAREAQADLYFEEIIDIADELEIDAKYKGEEVTLDVSSSAVARNRLRVDARKWIASKLAPKKYGDKLELSGDPDRPVVPNLTVTFVKPSGATS
jgi:hypothetical protein